MPSNKEHLRIEKYKEVTNYKNTKELLNNIDLELPKTSDIKDFKKNMINRDEKIEKFEKIFENIKITVKSFISWVARKLSTKSEDEIIHKFETETYIDFNLEKQFDIKEIKEKEYELEL